MGRRQPAPGPSSSSRRRKTAKGKQCPGAQPSGTQAKGAKEAARSITETAITLGDEDVAAAVAELLPTPRRPGQVLRLMRRWMKPILKAPIPGRARQPPTKAMLERAKRRVLRFYEREEALGDKSHVVKAFLLASNEKSLRFDWERARARVRRARFDMRKKIDSWEECLAMSSGDTNALSEIYICGTKKVTELALGSLVCHEGLHNLALRQRRGNPFLSEDTEHLAMALLGDPQLVHAEDEEDAADERGLPSDDAERLALDLVAEWCPKAGPTPELSDLLEALT